MVQLGMSCVNIAFLIKVMYVQGYSRVIMGLTNVEMQPVIHFHRLRGSFIFIF
jgi:hypothetical protein